MRLFFTVCTLAASLLFAQAVPIARWSQNKAAAYSLTFDDSHIVQLRCAQQELDRRSLRGTFYVVTWNRTPDDGWTRPDWVRLRAMADSGHEIGGHSLTHSGLSNEVKPCIDSLRIHFPEKQWFTWAYPVGDNSAASTVMLHTIAARSWNDAHGIELQNPPDFSSITAINGWNNPYPSSTDNSWMVQAINAKGWGVETIHCIGSSPDSCGLAFTFTQSEFGEHLDTLLNHQSQLWIATFGDVFRYIRERQCASATIINNSTDSVRIQLVDTLSVNVIYNMPLTLKLSVPAGWTQMIAYQGGQELPLSVIGDTALIDAVPDAGNIIVQRQGFSSTARARQSTINKMDENTPVEIINIQGRVVARLHGTTAQKSAQASKLVGTGCYFICSRQNGKRVLKPLVVIK